MKVVFSRHFREDVEHFAAALELVSPSVAQRFESSLRLAVRRLAALPRVGPRIEGFEPRELRRLLIGDYELRYEIADGQLFVLRIFHVKENR